MKKTKKYLLIVASCTTKKVSRKNRIKSRTSKKQNQELLKEIDFGEPLLPTLTDYRYLLNRFSHIMQLIKAIPKIVSVNFVSLNVEPIRNKLYNRTNTCFESIIGILNLKLMNMIIEIENIYATVTDKLNYEVKTPEEWEEIQNFINNIKSEVLDVINIKIRDILTVESIFEEVNYSIPSTMTNPEMKKKYSQQMIFQILPSEDPVLDKMTIENRILRCRKIPQLINKAIPLCKDVLNRKYLMMAEDINNTRLDLYNRIEVYDEKTKQIETKTTIDFQKPNGTDDIYELICACDKYYNNLVADIDMFNKHEMIFKIEQTLFPSLKQISSLYSPFHDIWSIAYEHSKCTQEVLIKTFREINEKELEEKIQDWSRECYRVMKSFERNKGKGIDYQNTYMVSVEVYKEINEFKAILPIILALRNQGMKQRHWDKINALLNSKFENDDKLTLQNILALLEEKGYKIAIEQGGLGEYENFKDQQKEDKLALQKDSITETAEQDGKFNTPRKLESETMGLDGSIPVPGSQASFYLKTALQKYLPTISSISEEATKEFQLLTTFKNLETSWRSMCFSTVRYKDTESFMIRQTDDMAQQLDDNIIMLQTMMGSQFSYAIKDRLRDFERQLQNVSRFIDLWLTCQRQWLYLYPIFTSPDIRKQMPTESTNFQEVDLTWQEVSGKLNASPNTLNFIKTNENIFELLKNANMVLEKINKRLSSYLETKRLSFPRFFFLSNDELLAILSQTRDPRAVQPHLSKCFEGINLLEFVEGSNEKDNTSNEEGGKLKIISMISSEGEVVPFVSVIYPIGDTDAWMNMIEREMRNTLRVLYDKCYMNYNERMVEWNNIVNTRAGNNKQAVQQNIKGGTKELMSQPISSSSILQDKSDHNINNSINTVTDQNDLKSLPGREGWIVSWPAQLIIAVNQIIWTSEVEDAISGGGIESLRVYLEELKARISRIVKMVRGNLTKQARQLLSNLLILDVHSRNVTADLINKLSRGSNEINSNFSDSSTQGNLIGNIPVKYEEVSQQGGINNFSWTSQLRYYRDIENKGITVKQVNTVLEYCWEYLGIGSRLVITPLTDRCYMSLTGALRLNLGGSPQGPAGTGKTETVKDLGKALAIQTVVFNCLHGGSEILVLDERGEQVHKMIKDVSVGDKILTYKKQCQTKSRLYEENIEDTWIPEVSEVTKLLKRKDKLLYIRSSTGQEITCTSDHPIQVRMFNDGEADVCFVNAGDLLSMDEDTLIKKDVRLVCSTNTQKAFLSEIADNNIFNGEKDSDWEINMIPLLSMPKMLSNLKTQFNVNTLRGTIIESQFKLLYKKDKLIPLSHPSKDKRIFPLMRLFGAAHGYSELTIDMHDSMITGYLFVYNEYQLSGIINDVAIIMSFTNDQKESYRKSFVEQLDTQTVQRCFIKKPLKYKVKLPCRLVILFIAMGMDIRGVQEIEASKRQLELKWSNFYHKINRRKRKYGITDVSEEFTDLEDFNPNNPLPISEKLIMSLPYQEEIDSININNYVFFLPLGISPTIPDNISYTFPLSCCKNIVSGFVSMQPISLTFTSNVMEKGSEDNSVKKSFIMNIPKIIKNIRWCSRYPLEGSLKWETENICPIAKILKERFGIDISYESRDGGIFELDEEIMENADETKHVIKKNPFILDVIPNSNFQNNNIKRYTEEKIDGNYSLEQIIHHKLIVQDGSSNEECLSHNATISCDKRIEYSDVEQKKEIISEQLHPILICSCSIPNPSDQFIFFNNINFCYNKNMGNITSICRNLLCINEGKILTEYRNVGISSLLKSILYSNSDDKITDSLKDFYYTLILENKNYFKTKRNSLYHLQIIAERIKKGLPFSDECIPHIKDNCSKSILNKLVLENMNEPLFINKEVYDKFENNSYEIIIDGGNTKSIESLVEKLEDIIGIKISSHINTSDRDDIAINEDETCRTHCVNINIPDIIYPKIECITTVNDSVVNVDNLHDVYDITVGEGSTHTFICNCLIVHNCSEGLNVASMGRMFTGLAICGAWSCLDEFNRIDIEVLSVVAQQILTIQQAVRAGVSKFIFEGREIPLNRRVGTFITMNPGYAGRTELPDNLKALFRPVSMMMPNYTIIAEIMLFSSGYEKATNLAEKLTTTLRLSSEQLSAQDHYDFGMRALKAILTAAGELKRVEPTVHEDLLCLRALLDVNLPKFLDQDVPLFKGIIADLFPGIDFPEETLGDIDWAVRAKCVAHGLDPTNVFLNKVRQLISTLQVRHGLMLVGSALSGKSEITQILAEARTEMANIEYAYLRKNKSSNTMSNMGNKQQPTMTYHPTIISRLNPKSLPIEHLYGTFDPDTNEWHDGTIANLIRSAAQDVGKTLGSDINTIQPPLNDHWIVFDGPVDAVWIENMNTVLDDNKKLCLNSGEVIQLSPRMSMVFEVEDLAVASPATVSRCGMVYCETKNVTRNALIHKWLRSLPNWIKTFTIQDKNNNTNNDNSIIGDVSIYTSRDNNVNENNSPHPPPIEQKSKLQRSARTGRRMRKSSINNLTGRKLSDIPTVPLPFGYLQNYILSLCDWLLHPTVLFVEQHIRPMCPLPDMTLIVQFTRCFSAVLDSVVEELGNNKNDTSDQKQREQQSSNNSLPFDIEESKLKGIIDAVFLFALIWSVGVNCTNPDRKKINHFIRWLIQAPNNNVNSNGDEIENIEKEDATNVATNVLFDLTKHTNDNKDWIALEELLGHSPVFLSPGQEFSNNTEIIRKMNNGYHILQYNIPPKLSIYDYTFNPSSRSWCHWLQDPRYKEEMDKDIDFNKPVQTIFVPTLESVRNSAIVKILLKGKVSTLICGPTGTSKTTIVKNVLQQLEGIKTLMGMNNYHSIPLCFTARTSVDQMQSIIEAKLVRRRKGEFGPPIGSRDIIFVDDFNMPNPEKYGAQPPLELVRQWFDDGGWYDLSTKDFKHIVDSDFVCSMLPPGGGRSPIPGRLIHHFNTVCFPELSRDTLESIFRPMINNFLSSLNNPLGNRNGMMVQNQGEIQHLVQLILGASTDLYFDVKKEVLPTPSKSHYTFNLRDLSKIYQGLFLFDIQGYYTSANVQPNNQSQEQLTIQDHQSLSLSILLPLLWINESQRVIGDRLVDEGDREWFKVKTEELLDKYFKTNREKLVQSVVEKIEDADSELPIFSNLQEDPEAKNYKPVFKWKALDISIEKLLSDYNGSMSTQLDIVPFHYAVDHLARISRILMQPQGHALLVGIGGSGRQSLTRLASFALGYDFIQLDTGSQTYGINEWKEDLKKIFSQSGAKGRPVVVLFTESQLRLPSQLEDINNILNIGDVPNLWQPDELQQNLEAVASALYAEQGIRVEERTQLMEHFERRIKDNLHLVMSFSPLGSSLRQKLISFPSLVNCTTIDWFTEWPNEALISVAKEKLFNTVGNEFNSTVDTTSSSPKVSSSSSNKFSLTDDEKQQITDVTVSLHSHAQNISKLYSKQERHELFVTPALFTRFLSSFNELRKSKSAELSYTKYRYQNGLEKLLETQKQVEKMTEEQEALKPLILEATKETAVIMADITKAKAKADEAKAVVLVEEQEAQRQTEAANKISDECQANLQLALPKLEAAEKALMTLNKNDIIELKSMKNPPKGVKLVMEATCVMRQIPPKITLDTSTGKKMADYWPSALTMLSDSKFLQTLLDYDKENIPDKVITDITPYYKNTDFTPQKILTASKAASGLCAWVRAMYEYHFVDLNVRPMRVKLAEARAELAKCENALKEKQDHLAEIERNIKNLEDKYNSAVKKKDDLAQQALVCEQRLKRAETLITGLSGEKERWEQEVETLEKTETTVIGDSILAAAAVTYSGVFPIKYRSKLLSLWQKEISSRAINISEKFSLTKFLGNELRIQEWGIQGLPTDSFSIENAIICFQSGRYPLMIDPQEQANIWIKNMFTNTTQSENVRNNSEEKKTRQLVVVKPNDPNFSRNIENALTFGNILLLEDVGTSLSPLIVPLATKQFIRQAGGYAVKLGDRIVDIGKGFELYMTTSSPKPNIPPEVSAGVTLLNFAITPEGAENQLLSKAISLERPELEEERKKLVEENTGNRRKLKDIETRILSLLSNSSGNILDDIELIETLDNSKTTSAELKRKLEMSKKTEERISKTRELYRPLASRAATVFFATNDMESINNMYQYSLEWFLGLFEYTIKNTVIGLNPGNGISGMSNRMASVPSYGSLGGVKGTTTFEQTKQRIIELREKIGIVTYRNVCRSLFAKDKLCYALSLCLRIDLARGNITEDEINEMLTGRINIASEGEKDENIEESSKDIDISDSLFSEQAWKNIEQLDKTEYYKGIKESILTEKEKWKEWVNSPLLVNPPLFGGALREYTLNLANNSINTPQNTQIGKQGYNNSITGNYESTRYSSINKGPNTNYSQNSKNFHFPYLRQLHLIHLLLPEAFIMASQRYIQLSLSPEYTKPPQLDLNECYQESKPQEPFVFILSPGADPISMLLAFADSKKMGGNNFQMKSLGQGQGPIAEKLIAEGIERGLWVLLANIHLVVSWMPRLEMICNTLRRNKKVHPSFRLFLTSMPSTSFPSSILQNALKITTEAPVGIQANMERLYRQMDDKILGNHTIKLRSSLEYRQLLYNLVFMFSMLLERRRFGPLGFNVQYDFNDSDVTISEQQLLMFFEEYDQIPFEALKYITGEINIGGRVTDDKDRLLINALLEDYYTPAAFEISHVLSESPLYTRPDIIFQNNVWARRGESTEKLHGTSIKDAYIRHINTYPQTDEPLVFGLHSNAAITLRRTETNNLLESMLSARPEMSRVVKDNLGVLITQQQNRRGRIVNPIEEVQENNRELDQNKINNEEKESIEEEEKENDQDNDKVVKEVLALCSKISNMIPPLFDSRKILAEHPITYEDSMSTVLHQEVEKYNNLLIVVSSSLKRVESALKGLAVMTAPIEEAFNSIMDGKVPSEWTAKAYPTCYPLMEWVDNLCKRIEFIKSWSIEKPKIFWFSGLFFPQGFLTGLLQNFARKYKVPIDEVEFIFDIMDSQYKIDKYLDDKDNDGTLCNGLFLQGGRWDYKKHILADSIPNELFFPMPVISFIPISHKNKPLRNDLYTYECPCYRTPERRGVLTTTGRSSNYILDITLPIGTVDTVESGIQNIDRIDKLTDEEKERRKYQKKTFWIKHGTALLMQMEY